MKKKTLQKLVASVSAVCLFSGAAGIGAAIAFAPKANAEDNEALNAAFELTNAAIVSPAAAAPVNDVSTDYASGVKFKVNSSSSYIDFNHVVDLRKVEGNLIEFIPNSDTQAFGLTGLRVRITDANDASNSVAISWKVNPDGPRLLSEGGDSEKLVKASPTLCCSFIQVEYMGMTCAYPNYAPETAYTIGWWQNWMPTFDYSTKDKWVPCAFSYNYETNEIIINTEGAHNVTNKTVVGLDSEEDDFPDFGGFSTGEVYITIESVGSAGEFLCTKIGNVAMADLADGKADVGGLMFNGYDFEEMVNGVVGYPYPMPVSANKNPVTAKLEKLSGTDTWTDVTARLTENGTKFTPKETGKYRLTYSGKTNAGTDATVSGEFEVIQNPVEIEEKSPVSLAVDITDAFVVPTVQYTGGIGKLNVKYTLKLNGEDQEVVPGDAFLIDRKGMTLTLTVDVTDKVSYAKQFVYPVAVNENVKDFRVLGFNVVSVNEGDTITVPDFVANDYSKTNIDGKADVKITSDFTSGNLSVGDSITVDKDGFVTYVWGEEKITYQVICAPKKLTADNVAELFKTPDASKVEVTALGLEYTVNKANAVITMPNPVSVNELDIEYSLYNRYGFESNGGKYNEPFTAVNVYLQSISGKRVCLYVDRFTALRPTMYINGKKASSLTSYVDQFVDSSNLKSKHRKFSFSFDEGTATVYSGTGLKIGSVTTWDNGLPFDGFEEGKVLVSFELVGGQSGNKLVVNTLSNQKFSTVNLAYGDMTSPVLALKGELETSFKDLGDVVQVPMAYAYDVLCAKSSIKMTVQTPDGTQLSSVAPQEYELVLSKPGKYVVSYAVTDKNRNSFTYEFVYRVLDTEPPVITVNGEYQKTYSGKVKVVGASVSDNCDTAESKTGLYILLANPDLTYDILSEGQTLNLTKGQYAIVYFAMDTDGNTTLVRYEFEVK